MSVAEGGWYYRGSSNEIRLAVSSDIFLHGVQHFGRPNGEYAVAIRIKEVSETDSLSSLTEQSGSYSSVKAETDAYHGFDVMFDQPACLEKGKLYELVSDIRGPDSWYGLEGKATVESFGVTFRFSRTFSCVSDVTRGQFPALIFSLYV